MLNFIYSSKYVCTKGSVISILSKKNLVTFWTKIVIVTELDKFVCVSKKFSEMRTAVIKHRLM